MRQAIRKAKVAFPTAVITSVAWLGGSASGSAGHAVYRRPGGWPTCVNFRPLIKRSLRPAGMSSEYDFRAWYSLGKLHSNPRQPKLPASWPSSRPSPLSQMLGTTILVRGGRAGRDLWRSCYLSARTSLAGTSLSGFSLR